MPFAPAPAAVPAYTLPAKDINTTRIIIEIMDNKITDGNALIGVMYRDGHLSSPPLMDIPSKEDTFMFNGVRYLVIGRHWTYSTEANGDTVVEIWVELF